MTTDLVTIFKTQIGEDEVNSVSARDLHTKLECTVPYNKWTNRRFIKNVYCEEDSDWILLVVDDQQKGSGGHNKKDYAIKLDLAKKIAMSEQTTQGEKVRDYFLGCEKKAKKAHKNLNNQEKIKQIRATMRRLSGCLTKLEKHGFENQIRALEDLQPVRFTPPKLNRPSMISEIASNMGIELQSNHETAIRIKSINEFKKLYYPKQTLQTRTINKNRFEIQEPIFPTKDIYWVENFIFQQTELQDRQLEKV